jgi:pimeloyl-ACP methyl ester carboxylesterase
LQRTTGYVGINGMKMYYEIHSQGKPEAFPLIVLHGAYMNIPSMGTIVPRLAKTHKVYAVEFQGHGRTSDIDRPITYPNLADDVAVFMNAVGLAKADVFGYDPAVDGGDDRQIAFRRGISQAGRKSRGLS